MMRRKLISIPRSALATYVVCTFFILSAFAIAILQINRRADQNVRSTHDVGVCVLRELAKFNLRVRLSSEQNAQANNFRLAVPPDLEPRLPVQSKKDPCHGLLTSEHIDVAALLKELGAVPPSSVAPTSPVTSAVPQSARLHRSVTSPTRGSRTTTTRPATSGTTTPPPPPQPPTTCAGGVPQLCALLP